MQGYNFYFWLFLVVGHMTTLSTTYQMDPDRCNHLYLVFLHFLVKPGEIFELNPDMDPESSVAIQCIHHPYFCDFSVIFY